MTESQSPEENQPEQPSYPHMPYGADAAPQGPPPAPPSDVTWASRVLYAMSAFLLIIAILTPTTRDDVREGLHEVYPDRSESDINSLADQLILISIVISVVFALIYGLLAWKIPQGAGWTRITATVSLGIYLFFSVLGLGAGGAGILALLAMAASLVALVLLWRRSASEYFREMALRRRPR